MTTQASEMRSKTWTQDEIKTKIQDNQEWLERAVLAIYQRQTEDEQIHEATIEHNKVGFSGVDAKYMSWIAGWIASGRHLSGKHLDKTRTRMTKYAGQLTKIANGQI